jgi:hypothetical protein
MRLTRAPGIVRVDLNKIAFMVSDVGTGATVECRASVGALRKLRGGGSTA